MIKLPSHLLFILLTTASSSINLVSAQGGACFKDRTELKFAVDSCWEGGKGAFSDPGSIVDQTYGATDILNDANEADCNDVKAKYGWPIGTWYVLAVCLFLWYNITQKSDLLINLVYHANKNRCVKDVTDMHFLFNRKETFNEDINSWNVSSGKYAFVFNKKSRRFSCLI